MKLSYNHRLRKYVISQLGKVIDSSDTLNDLLIRYGTVEDEPDESTPFDKAEGGDYGEDLDRLFENILEVN